MREQLLVRPGLALAGVVARGSPIVAGLADTSRLIPGQVVSCKGYFDGNTLVASVDSDTQATLTGNARRAGSTSIFFRAEPMTVADAKLHCRSDYAVEDASFANWIVAARKLAELHTRQALLTQTWKVTLDGFPSTGGYLSRDFRQQYMGMSIGGFYDQGMPGFLGCANGAIELPRPPLQSVTSVKYYDMDGVLQTLSPSSYLVSAGTPGRIQPAFNITWPVPRPTLDSVEIEYVAGYGDYPEDVPEELVSGMKLLVSHWNFNREAVGSGSIFTALPFAIDSLFAVAGHRSYA